MSEQTSTSRPVTQVSPAEGTAWWFTTDLYITKLVSEDTDGAFTMFEITVAPQSPPLAHKHLREDEIYYVLDGEFEFMDDDRTFKAGQGSLVYLRKGRFHYHRNAGDSRARALVVWTPAGNIEAFIAEASKPAADPSALPPSFDDDDVQRLVDAAQRYGFETPPEAD